MEPIQFFFESSYLSLPPAMYVQQKPVPVASPALVLFNAALAQKLGLEVAASSKNSLAAVLAGNRLPAGAVPFAQAYAGHQFGHFTMLGDGRAIMLGEHVSPAGGRVDIQLKGAGVTPFSRRGDGRAALAPMLREYVISEAMNALGISTTRSLAVVSTGEAVQRERVLPGAVLVRVAASHLRVGTFEYAARLGDVATLKALADYTINRHYPECTGAENSALALLRAVMHRQIELVVHWMRTGFIHGVMNTDNVSLAGETIDYGPCAFMDTYSRKTVFSSIDTFGRYAFGNQPLITGWNLARFAETLLPLIGSDREKAAGMAENVLGEFEDEYQKQWLGMMRRKLGLLSAQEGDEALLLDLLVWMEENTVDYTNTFHRLAGGVPPQGEAFRTQAFTNWHERWMQRLLQNNAPVAGAWETMRQTNPAFIPRNHLVNAALESAEQKNDMAPLHTLLQVLAAPYSEQPEFAYMQKEPSESEKVQHTFCGT